MKRDSYKGIPKTERKEIAQLVALHRVTGGKSTPQDFWASKQKQLEAKRQEEAKAAERRKEDVREEALRAIRPALDKLRIATDLARMLEERHEGLGYMEPDAWAAFIRMSIDEGGRNLEQALIDLDLWKPEKCGVFVPRAT